jgi:hypothetical protein
MDRWRRNVTQKSHTIFTSGKTRSSNKGGAAFIVDAS